jgi:hypothetical protein
MTFRYNAEKIFRLEIVLTCLPITNDEEAMNHTTCDSCGRDLLTDSEVRYEVRIEVKAAYDPLEVSAEDLAKDYRTEIAKVLRQLEGISTTEAQNQVYRVFNFDLCPDCQRRYIRSLLSVRFLPS